MRALLPAAPELYVWLAGIALLGVAIRITWWWRIERAQPDVDPVMNVRCPECGLDLTCNRCGWAVHRDLCPRRLT